MLMSKTIFKYLAVELRGVSPKMVTKWFPRDFATTIEKLGEWSHDPALRRDVLGIITSMKLEGISE